MEDVSKELEDVKKKNVELESPNDLKDTKKLEEEIKSDMQQSSEELRQKKQEKCWRRATRGGRKKWISFLNN